MADDEKRTVVADFCEEGVVKGLVRRMAVSMIVKDDNFRDWST